uniref:RNase H type-1 domain-containing protein n=1 Tax=Chenopodium quinoa TaxID=63459 RepID=A0A803MTY3_CHEQI
MRKMKEYLANPLILSKPKEGEPLQHYLAVVEGTISAVLTREEDKEQFPIYYVSKPYSVRKPDFSPALEQEAQKEALSLQEPKPAQKWRFHTDGAANIREYEALITRLTIAKDMRIKHQEVISDSLLIVNQINGEYAAKDAKMVAYLEVVRNLIKEFKFKIAQVPRNLNTKVDALANLGSNINPDEFGATPLVHVMYPSIEKESTMNVYEVQENPTDEEDSWTKPFKDFLTNKVAPKGKVVAHAFVMKASKYCLISNVLFKKSAAMIPMEVEVPTARYGLMTKDRNQSELAYNLDTVKEIRDDAKMRMEAYQQEVARIFNKNVRVKIFKVGDWALRKVYENTREVNTGKLAPNWEGPYEITKVVGNRAYRLRNVEGKEAKSNEAGMQHI